MQYSKPIPSKADLIRSLFPPPKLPPVPEPILSPAELERFGNLLMFAKSTVEGFFAGKHKSVHRGASVEFADYKEYVPGDDIKHIDWRAYGRSRRLYLRQFEAETDMAVYLVLDSSVSMSYKGRSLHTKYRMAAKIAAAFAYLMIQQLDKVSLVIYSEKILSHQPLGGTRNHLNNVIHDLEYPMPALRTKTAQTLTECDGLFKRRGRLILLSDFWDDTESTFNALSRFIHRKFEILLLQVVTPQELNLQATHAARFVDMETKEAIEVEPEDIRTSYREASRQWVEKVAREAYIRGISHQLINTERPYIDAIEAYLGFRDRNTFSTR